MPRNQRLTSQLHLPERVFTVDSSGLAEENTFESLPERPRQITSIEIDSRGQAEIKNRVKDTAFNVRDVGRTAIR